MMRWLWVWVLCLDWAMAQKVDVFFVDTALKPVLGASYTAREVQDTLQVQPIMPAGFALVRADILSGTGEMKQGSLYVTLNAKVRFVLRAIASSITVQILDSAGKAIPEATYTIVTKANNVRQVSVVLPNEYQAVRAQIMAGSGVAVSSSVVDVSSTSAVLRFEARKTENQNTVTFFDGVNNIAGGSSSTVSKGKTVILTPVPPSGYKITAAKITQGQGIIQSNYSVQYFVGQTLAVRYTVAPIGNQPNAIVEFYAGSTLVAGGGFKISYQNKNIMLSPTPPAGYSIIGAKIVDGQGILKSDYSVQYFSGKNIRVRYSIAAKNVNSSVSFYSGSTAVAGGSFRLTPQNASVLLTPIPPPGYRISGASLEAGSGTVTKDFAVLYPAKTAVDVRYSVVAIPKPPAVQSSDVSGQSVVAPTTPLSITAADVSGQALTLSYSTQKHSDGVVITVILPETYSIQQAQVLPTGGVALANNQLKVPLNTRSVHFVVSAGDAPRITVQNTLGQPVNVVKYTLTRVSDGYEIQPTVPSGYSLNRAEFAKGNGMLWGTGLKVSFGAVLTLIINTP